MSSIFLPRSMRIGAKTLNDLPEALRQLGLKSPVILTDSFMVTTAAHEQMVSVLQDAGMRSRTFNGVVPDPTVKSVDKAVEFIKQGSHDCIIGFGGGSSLDSAKAAAVLSQRGGMMRDLKAPHQENVPGLPIIAIPTTAGSGSEATRFTIITDEGTDEKMLCVGLAYLPTLAIVDYELTLSTPARLTADTGIDALTHAIEAYVSKLANPFSDSMALSAMQAIWPNLRTVYTDPGNHAAREAMMIGSMQAGVAFSNASVALVHGMSRPIGAHFHVAHGLSNAMLLSTITKWSSPEATGRYSNCARVMGIAEASDHDEVAVEKLVDALQAVNRDLQVPTPESYGIDRNRWIELLPLMAEQALQSGSPNNNPRVPTAEDIQNLYSEAWSETGL